MGSVGINLPKNKLSEYVRAADAGETVLITDVSASSPNWSCRRSGRP
jgi:hypothetical protein